MITDRVIKAAMALRAEAPRGWEEFVTALQEQAAMSTSDMLRCQPEMLVRAQGMAIASNEIANALVDAPNRYDKMQGIIRNGRPSTQPRV